MSITCPRCSTDIPDEANFCPYCNLQKPKLATAAPVGSSQEQPRTDQPAKAPALKRDNLDGSRRPTRQPESKRNLRLPVLGVAALVALFSVGIYIFVVPLVHSEEAEPKTVLAALTKLRQTPSNEPGLTIDARLLQELEKSRRVGNLVAYQGWTVKPVKGTKTKVLLSFSYQETGDIHQRAEWLGDLTNNTFKPQTELAVSISQ